MGFFFFLSQFINSESDRGKAGGTLGDITRSTDFFQNYLYEFLN